ncbi:MAG: AMIN domain-containing protein, partial [Burkholderiaceae bacterium]|nr:AMIN domain-containing protein [Burkholderiaceae bacterium]
MPQWRHRIAALLLACAAPFLAATAAMAQGAADNSIQSITSTQQAGAEVVRIEMAAPLAAVPNGFAVQTPPRVALDLPAVGNALGKSVVDINQGNLRSVAIAQAGDRTRLVLNLRQSSSYRAELQGKVLVVVLENNAAPGMAASTGEPVHFAAAQNR